MTSQPEALRLITDTVEARACFDSLVESFAELADEVAPHRAAFRPGSITATTYFFRRHGIWAMPTDGSQLSTSKNRYWNSFGLGGSPHLASTHISVEINHPHSGKSNVSGRFLTAHNRFYLGHTGRIGGGLRGSDASAIERITGRLRSAVKIDGRPQRLEFLSSIESSETFIEQLAQFVQRMNATRAHLKAEAAQRRQR